MIATSIATSVTFISIAATAAALIPGQTYSIMVTHKYLNE